MSGVGYVPPVGRHRRAAVYRGRRRSTAVRTPVRRAAPYVGVGMVVVSAVLMLAVGATLVAAGWLP